MEAIHKATTLRLVQTEEWIEIGDSSEYRNGVVDFTIINTRILKSGDMTAGEVYGDNVVFSDKRLRNHYARWLFAIHRMGHIEACVNFGLTNKGIWMNVRFIRVDNEHPTTDIFDIIIDMSPSKPYKVYYAGFVENRPLLGYPAYVSIVV